MKSTLQGKILFIASVVTLCTVCAVIISGAYQSTREYKSAMESRSLAISKSLVLQFERLLALGLTLDEIVGFEDQCEEVVRAYPGIELAAVVDANGFLRFHSGHFPPLIDDALLQYSIAGAQGVIPQKIQDKLQYIAVIPAFSPQNEHVASVFVAFPSSLITQKVTRLLAVKLLAGFLVLVSGLVLLYLALNRCVGQPLSSLIATVSGLRESPNDLTRRTPIKTSDELGQLANSINDLMDELQSTTVSKEELQLALKQLRLVSDELFDQKEQAEVTLHSIGDAVISVDIDQKVLFLNPVAEYLTGWTSKEALGMSMSLVLHLYDSEKKVALPDPFKAAFVDGAALTNEVDAELQRRDGVTIGVDYTVAPIHDSKGGISGGVLTLRDVSKERSLTHQLSWEASHDSLTGLYNRREFTDRLSESLHTAREENRSHILCFMDLDRFKVINDAVGHTAGDEFLKGLVVELTEYARTTDTLARLGGDEFALILQDCTLENSEKLAENLLSVVGDYQYVNKGRVFTVGISIGLTIIDGGKTFAEIMTMADTACYLAKDRGRNRFYTYREGDEKTKVKRRR